MGKGAIIQAGKSPVGVAVQIPGNQKNKLNDPGGGSFRYTSPGLSRCQATHSHVGAAFHYEAPPHNPAPVYGLHSQLRL